MKKTKFIRFSFALAALTACALLGPALNSFSETKIRPTKQKYILGAWVGHDECGGEYLRIHLEEGGGGSAAYLLAEGPVDTWKISSWKVDGYITTISAETSATNGSPAKITLDSRYCYLKCRLDWGSSQREFKLLKEDELMKKFATLRATTDSGGTSPQH